MLAYIEFPDWISPEIIPGLPLRWYGMMYLVAFAVAYLLFVYQIRKRKLDIEQDTIVNFFFWGIVGLLIGARIFATLFFEETGIYWRKPWLIFWPFDQHFRFVGLQGMNYYGGLVGCIVGCIIYGLVKKLDLWDWGDMLVCGIPLGYFFGRMGNFINGELFGRVTTAPWGFIFPHARRFPADEPWVQEYAREAGMAIPEDAAMVNLPRHPTQLYEALFEGLVLWAIMWFLIRKRRPYRGFAIGMYVLLYGVMRFVIDYFRMPLGQDFALKLAGIENPPYLLLTPFNFLMSQYYSFAMVLGGAALLVIRYAMVQAERNRKDDQEGPRVNRRKLRKKLNKR
jgi:phosphatidylglycerol:prolipoprotein diacylglycerol transferase